MPVILKPKAERDADTVFEQLLVNLIVAAILIGMPVAVILRIYLANGLGGLTKPYPLFLDVRL